MAKINRVHQKIFGINGGANGIFGSAQANAPASGTISNNIEDLQSLPAYEQGWNDATLTASKSPTLEEFNGINKINTEQLSYLFQEGIPIWDVDTEYYQNSLVKEDGTTKIYKSLTDANTGNLLTDTVNWQFLTDLNITLEQNKVVVNSLDDLPTPIANVITLEDGKDYRVSGSVNIGVNRIVFGDNCALTGDNPQNDIIIYTGTGVLFTANDNNLVLIRIGVSCDTGTLFDATDIDYTIDPLVDPFQGRNKRFYINNCNLVGGVAGNGSTLGSVEGYGTINFNANFVRAWDAGLQVSNGLSFEGLNNKVVLWNNQGTNMITIRDNNWSGQTGGAGSYIPTGINALNLNGNILHPKGPDYAVEIEIGSTAKSANISGNIFIETGITTGGIFNPAGLGYNDIPTYNIQGNQGVRDNTATLQFTIDTFAGATTALTQNIPAKLDYNDTVKTSENILFSSRLLVTSAANFEEGQIITGGTSTYTGKIQSIDLANNYLYVEYVKDGLGNNQYFTIGETITSATASTTYNGVDGSIKYFGIKGFSARTIATITLQKTLAGSDLFKILLYKNGVAIDEVSSFLELDSGIPLQVTLQSISDIEQDDIIEVYIENTGSNDDVICQAIVFNISGR
jgi:hypothetical protein